MDVTVDPRPIYQSTPSLGGIICVPSSEVPLVKPVESDACVLKLFLRRGDDGDVHN